MSLRLDRRPHPPPGHPLAELFLRLFLLLPLVFVTEDLVLLQSVGVYGDDSTDGGAAVGRQTGCVQQVLRAHRS